MKANLKKHLEEINAEDLLYFKQDAFVSYASINDSGKSLNLGVGCHEGYIYMVTNYQGGKLHKFLFKTPEEAINKYTELLTN